jgi:hypothetical protein
MSTSIHRRADGAVSIGVRPRPDVHANLAVVTTSAFEL